MKKRNYFKAPIPFMGQKRFFIRAFSAVLEENIPDEGEDWTIVDVFGGSGLLAHTAKTLKPKARVIYNDFDGYSERLDKIKETNRLRAILLEALKGTPDEHRLTPAQMEQVKAIIADFDGEKDEQTICQWFSFSGTDFMCLDQLYKRNSWYKNIPKSDYFLDDDYLCRVEIISQDFVEFLPHFAGKEKTLIILDPPYLSTAQGRYKNDRYFNIVNFLTLIHTIKPPYIFFSSKKSEFMEYKDFLIRHKKDNFHVFENAKVFSRKSPLAGEFHYFDNMIYKF